MVSRGQATSPFSAEFDRYANVRADARISRTKSGTSRVVVRWSGLPFEWRTVSYSSHVHNLPCSVDNGGGHYKLDPSESGVIESNEMWLNFSTFFSSRTVRKTFRITARADAQSVVLHDPDTGSRVACADLDYKVGTLD